MCGELGCVDECISNTCDNKETIKKEYIEKLNERKWNRDLYE